MSLVPVGTATERMAGEAKHDPLRRDSDVAIAVLMTEFNGLTKTVDSMATQITALDGKVDRLAFVHPDVYLANYNAVIDRIKALESFQMWAVRTVLGAVFVSLLGAAYALKIGH